MTDPIVATVTPLRFSDENAHYTVTNSSLFTTQIHSNVTSYDSAGGTATATATAASKDVGKVGTSSDISSSSSSTDFPQDEWTMEQERHVKLWLMEMVKAVPMLGRTASSLWRISVMLTVLSHCCTAYTTIIPVATIGCSFLDEQTCHNLQISTIAVAIVGAIIALVLGSYNIGSLSREVHNTSKELMQLARRIDVELYRPLTHRNNAAQFCDTVAEEFNRIMTYSMPNLPRFLFWGNDMIDISLLSSYVHPRGVEENAIETPMELLTRRRQERRQRRRNSRQRRSDRAAMQKVREENRANPE